MEGWWDGWWNGWISSSSFSSIIFFFRYEELGWMDDGTNGW
jgi:hypothetical protein